MVEPAAPRSHDEVHAFFSQWIGSSNAGQWRDVAALMHDDIVLSDPMLAAPVRGRSAALDRVKAQYEPFPDGRIEMIGAPFVATDAPELAYRWHFVGTHERAIRPPGFAPTGRRVQVDGTSVLRFRDRQVSEVALFFDTTTVARQLLAAPPAGSPVEKVIALTQRTRVRLRRRQ